MLVKVKGHNTVVRPRFELAIYRLRIRDANISPPVYSKVQTTYVIYSIEPEHFVNYREQQFKWLYSVFKHHWWDCNNTSCELYATIQRLAMLYHGLFNNYTSASVYISAVIATYVYILSHSLEFVRTRILFTANKLKYSENKIDSSSILDTHLFAAEQFSLDFS